MNVNALLSTYFASIQDAVIEAMQNNKGIRAEDMGLLLVSSALGFAEALGATREEIAATCNACMRNYGKTEAEARRAQISLVGSDGKPLKGDT